MCGLMCCGGQAGRTFAGVPTDVTGGGGGSRRRAEFARSGARALRAIIAPLLPPTFSIQLGSLHLASRISGSDPAPAARLTNVHTFSGSIGGGVREIAAVS